MQGPVIIDMSIDRNRRFVLLIQLIGRLKIELRTGMKFKGPSTLKVAIEQFDLTSKTKKRALEELEAIKAKEFPEVA
jgi:hypothetical protein